MDEDALLFLLVGGGEDRVDEVDAGEEVLDDVGPVGVVDRDAVELHAGVSVVFLPHWRKRRKRSASLKVD